MVSDAWGILSGNCRTAGRVANTKNDNCIPFDRVANDIGICGNEFSEVCLGTVRPRCGNNLKLSPDALKTGTHFAGSAWVESFDVTLNSGKVP